MTHLRRRPRTAATALAVSALAAGAAVPATASGATSGATTIELGGAVARSLRAQGVTLSARKPAKANARRITLPVARGRVGDAATLQHGGSVSFRSRRGGRTRVATFTGWQTKLAPKRSTITAKLGKRRVALFVLTFPKRARASAETDGTVRLTSSTVRLTTAGARTLRRSLELTTLPAGVLGRARVDATVGSGDAPRPTTPNTGGGGGNTGGGNTGGGGGGGGGGGTPTPTPTPAPRCQGFGIGDVPEASAPLARPTSAPAVVAPTAFWWRPKDSWIRYINTGAGAGDGVVASAGATAGTPEVLPGSSAPLVYRYAFSLDPATSWYQDGRGVLYFTGKVRFAWADHGIDITVQNPEVQLDGAGGRVVFRFSGSDCSVIRDKRVEFTTFAPGTPSGVPPTYDFGNRTSTLTDAGNSAFGSMYSPGTEWGSIDLSLTTG